MRLLGHDGHDRGHARHDLQPGRPRRARLPVRHVGDRASTRAPATSARCIVVWGANPSACGPHQDEHWLGEAQGTVVVIDPIQTPTAARADIHLQPRPGTDAALAFGLMHVIARDGLVDHGYVDRHTVGFEELEPLLAACTPAWTAALHGRAPPPTSSASRACTAPGPSLLWLGQGLQRQPTGGNIFRACATLPAITGNLGEAGRRPDVHERRRPRRASTTTRWCPSTSPSPAPPISHMDLADVLADPARSRALVCWNMNIAASAPRQRDVLRALAPRRPVHARRRPVPDRHGALRRHRAAGGDVPRARRRRGAVLRSRPVGPGEGDRPARRGAARTARSSAAWRAAMGYDDPALYEPDDGDHGAVRRRQRPRAATWPSCARAPRVYPDGPAVRLQFADGVFDDAERPHRARQRRRRGRRPPARAAAARRRAAGRRACCACSPPRRRGR